MRKGLTHGRVSPNVAVREITHSTITSATERLMSEDFAPVDERSIDDDGRTPLALALGIAAAIAAGGLWAALVYVTSLEIGYAAVGVGFLVGIAMSRTTAQRTQQLAYAAALFSLLGLAAGKAFIWVASAGPVAEELTADEQVMKSAVAWQMYGDRSLDEPTLEAIDRTQAGIDTLSDAAWESMLAQAETKLAAMTAEEKQEIATATAKGIIRDIGIVGGIKAQLTPFDALWILLAVGTAYRMLAPAKLPEDAGVEQV